MPSIPAVILSFFSCAHAKGNPYFNLKSRKLYLSREMVTVMYMDAVMKTFPKGHKKGYKVTNSLFGTQLGSGNEVPFLLKSLNLMISSETMMHR